MAVPVVGLLAGPDPRDATLEVHQVCGEGADAGLLVGAVHQVEAVDVRNSGDTCGDKTRVVGYGAFILH